MRRRQFCRVFGCTMAWSVLPGSLTTAAADSIEDIGYWRRFSQELTPARDPRAAKAHAIFDRLVEVADKRRDVKLQLWIAASDPWQIGLPIAIRDGWIVLSKGVLEMCYREPTWGEDRLAFVLAHEMAHQLHDDLWHVRFAQAFEAQRLQDPALPQILEQLPRTTREVERVRERELRADESGMRYAALAGFNPHAIITQSSSEHFFAEWVRVLEPRFPGIGSVPPTPQERAEHLRAHLQRVANATSMFTIGLWSYYAGNYPQAIRAFEAFRSVFASREVLHNLAASYHQLALQAYEQWQPKPQTFPFQLSLLIEPLTRASRNYLERTRGPGAEPEAVFRQCLDKAIQGYEEALTQESDFSPALLNIGAAFILRGFHTRKVGPIHRDFSQAVARLSSAPEQAPPSPASLNNLGVALFYEERPERAKEALTLASTLAPDYAAPVFNLAVIARAEQRAAEAQRYMQRYEQITAWLTPQPPRAPQSPETLSLGSHTVHLGLVERAIPPSIDRPTRSPVVVDGTSFTMVTYPSGVMTLVLDGELIMLMAREGYQGQSVQGVGIGSREADIITRHGPPSRRHETTHGQNWTYDTQHIAFQFRNRKVVTWLIF